MVNNMQTFAKFLSEAAMVSNLKSYIRDALDVTLTLSGGRVNHIRFPMAGKDADHVKAFKKINVKVVEYEKTSISSKYPTKLLVLTKAIGKLRVGDSIPWVNRHAGAAKSGPRMFGNKSLTPDALGLAGRTLTSEQIMSIIEPKLAKSYNADTVAQLMGMCQAVRTKSNKISYTNSFDGPDLRVVSADFGEILSAIWSQSNLLFKSSFFPKSSNEPLVDFYGVRFGIEYPVSVKSGAGSKVSIQNILNSINKKAKNASGAELAAEKSLAVFKIVNEMPMKDQMIELHKFMDTEAIRKLSSIMNVRVPAITQDTIKDFVGKFEDQKDLVTALEPFWKVMNTKLEEKTKTGDDRFRLVLSPLGESIWKILNADAEMRESLTRLAKQVTLIQINIDVTKTNILFKNNYFKNSTFKFGWAGYAGKNKLGFQMVKKG